MKQNLLIFSLFFVLGFFVTFLVYGHDAPTGWSYDARCCNTTDCRPADGPEGPRHHPIQIIETSEGYRVIKPDGQKPELIEWGSKKIRPSQDGLYHVCTYGGSDVSGVICIYVPARSF